MAVVRVEHGDIIDFLGTPCIAISDPATGLPKEYAIYRFDVFSGCFEPKERGTRLEMLAVVEAEMEKEQDSHSGRISNHDLFNC